MKNLEILFRSPGLLEAIVIAQQNDSSEPFITEGYRSIWVTDLMVDYDPETDEPYSFMVHQFDRTYPLVIWALKMHFPERFNAPQANLYDVPLHQIFSWAYYHFILQDGQHLSQPLTHIQIDPTDYMQLTLGHALTMA